MIGAKLQKIKELNYETLNGFQKAAILLNYVGSESAQKFFEEMDDADIRKVINYMSKYRIVSIDITKKILEEYYELISENADYIFSNEASSKDIITNAVGEERARAILGHMSLGADEGHTLESLEVVDVKSLSNFLINEHPQTVAVILAHLAPDKKGEVLKRLPEVLQAEVVLRLSSLDHVSPELIAEVDKVLKDELSAIGTVESTNLGGVQPVAEMLNVMDKNTETAIMSRVDERDPILAEEIRKLMFVFEDISKIDDKGIQMLLKEVDNGQLLLALKTASEEIREKIYNNISQRAATLLKEDLENLGPSRVSDVEGAQQVIINVARRLEGEGKIIVARGGADDALV